MTAVYGGSSRDWEGAREVVTLDSVTVTVERRLEKSKASNKAQLRALSSPILRSAKVDLPSNAGPALLITLANQHTIFCP